MDQFLMVVIAGCAGLLFLYGVNSLVMVCLFLRRYEKVNAAQLLSLAEPRAQLPHVTTQVPIYNEANVVERVIDAVCRIEYPKGYHHIQILDDSTDETAQLVDRVVALRQEEGHDIQVLRRSHREGFKAGALHAAQASIQGDYVAIFDADFEPKPDFLIKAMPFLEERKDLGFLQARWGHLNAQHSPLTRAQALGIDGHFMVEQCARCWNGLYLNFNGTAGVWRVKAIEVAGGWSWETLTEDMDLSYRVQLKGWGAEYVPSLEVPSELPEDINAFKSQQYRWAKGSIQCAKLLLPRIFRQEGFNFRAIQAFFHMTHYAIHPLMVTLSITSLFSFGIWNRLSTTTAWCVVSALLFSMLSTQALYLCSQVKLKSWPGLKGMLAMPALMLLGVGIALNNTRAVLEALMGRSSEFVRTPKRGREGRVKYRSPLKWMVGLEILLGGLCLFAFLDRIQNISVFQPFLCLYAASFITVGTLTLWQSLPRPNFQTR